MNICEQYCDYLYNYFTANGRCAHYIEKPKIHIVNQGHIKKISSVYNSQEIEFKINKNRLEKITQDFFTTNQKINCMIIENIGLQNNKTNITVNIPDNIVNENSKNIIESSIIVEDSEISSNNSYTSYVDIESISDDEENITDDVEVIEKPLDIVSSNIKYFL